MLEGYLKNNIEEGYFFKKEKPFHKKLISKTQNKDEGFNIPKEYTLRIETSKKLDIIYKQLNSGIDITEIKDVNINEIYNDLEQIINEDDYNKRIILYLPFELLDKDNNFNNFYKSKFIELLNEIDYREDFNKGDIPEINIRKIKELPLVSKACHLIPFLIKKDIFKIEEILNIIEDQKNPIIINSFCDTLNILREQNFLNTASIEKLNKSKHLQIKNTLKLIELENIEPDDLKSCEEVFSAYKKEIENSKNFESPELPPNRVKWLKENNKENTILKYTKILENTKNTKSYIKDKLENPENEQEIILILKFIETIILNKKNEDLLDVVNENKNNPNYKYQPLLINFSEKIKNTKNNTLENKALSYGIEKGVKTLSQEINKDNYLKEKIYNVIFLGGSYLKGYATPESDLDLNIIIRPNTNFRERDEIQKHLENIIKKHNLNASIMEFWTKENINKEIEINDFEDPDNNLADSSMTSILFSDLYGDTKDIKEIQEKLLPSFANKSEKFLIKTEHDFLQYRLVQKGYYKNHIKNKILDSKFISDIDGDSAFFDPGYRRLATKLFLEKIYFPK